MSAGRTDIDAAAMLERAREIVSPSLRDPRLFYPSMGHQDGLERLRHSTVPGTLVVVSGEAGIGKTLLLQVLLESLAPSIAPVVVDDPAAHRPDTRFLRSLIALAGGEPRGRSGLELTADFLQRVEGAHAEGRMVSLLIDDAHTLSSSQLDILRTLLSSAGPAHPVNVALFGEPELLDKIARKRGLAERVTMHHALNPLNPDDAIAMLGHRLKGVGIDDPGTLFTTDALDALYTLSRGMPGAMFALAHAALGTTSAAQPAVVDRELLLMMANRTGPHHQIRLPLGTDTAGGYQPNGATRL